MQPKNKGRKRILRTNASVSGPIKVRNLKTGELAIYTPDKLQPTIPAGWVPLNSSKATQQGSFKRDSNLMIQTCGNQYRILNSSRQVVAQGKLNAAWDRPTGMVGRIAGVVEHYNPEVLKYYDVMTIDEAADAEGITSDDYIRDEQLWRPGHHVIGILHAKPEYAERAEYDGMDFVEVWDDGLCAQMMGGEGSRNGHWLNDVDLSIFEDQTEDYSSNPEDAEVEDESWDYQGYDNEDF